MDKETPVTTNEAVNHPSHYVWLKEFCGIEPIDITRHLNFNLGNSIKYILRAGKKPLGKHTDNNVDLKEGAIQDLKKAIFYLNDEIDRIEAWE